MGLTLRQVRAASGRLLLCAAGSGALIGVACASMMATTASRAVSMLVEPFSLFLLPGVAVAMAWTTAEGHLKGTPHTKTIADNHDFTSGFVVWCAFLFYVAVFYWWLPRRRNAQTPAAGSR